MNRKEDTNDVKSVQEKVDQLIGRAKYEHT